MYFVIYNMFFLFHNILHRCRSPEEASVKQKMVYSSSKDALRKALGDGLARDVQANDISDLDIANILDIIGRNDRF